MTQSIAKPAAIRFAILAVQLTFQHANVDYRLGPLPYLLGVAEVHRWHHRDRERFEDAQATVNNWSIQSDRTPGRMPAAVTPHLGGA